jgi:predicted DNA-binding transcriptional regulator AlpA
MPERTKWMTAEDVCEFLDLPSRATLYAQRYRGDPPGSLAVLVGRHLRWDPDDIDAWLDDLKASRRSTSVGTVTGSSNVTGR